MNLDDARVLSSPAGYCTVNYGWHLYPWQADTMNALDPEGSKAALRTCNESGKTSQVLCGLIGWHMDAFPGSMTVTTSGSNRQIKHQLYPNLRNTVGRLPGWRVQDSNSYSVRAPNGSVCVSFATDDPGLAEGFHVPPIDSAAWQDWRPPEEWGLGDWVPQPTNSLMILADEAKSIDQGIFDAIDRCHPTRLLIASSPGEPMGPFFDCFHGQKRRFWNGDTYNLFHASYIDCPHLMNDPQRRRDIEEQIAIRGRLDQFVQSMAFGEFAASGENMVFNMLHVDHAMSGLVQGWGDQLRAAVDLSGGGDEAPLYIRRGNRCFLDSSFRESDAPTLNNKLKARFVANQLEPGWITADEGGLGDPICDFLRRDGWNVERINFGSKAEEPLKYRNARAEMYFRLAQRIGRHEIALPNDPVLREQLGWQQYELDEGNKIKLIPKEQMPSSPDRADTVAMLYYKMPGKQSYEKHVEENNRLLSATLPAQPRIGFETRENISPAEQEGLLF
ncbi:hypothetical protein [Pararhizobium sp.]|uniref:hypothetical protein n=1 Tax=Pararhizobium sp. TaxID=1977563 RepID=UPI003D0ABBC5